MAFGFQSSAFQGPGFQQNSGGARPIGGWYDNTGWEDLFLRPVKLGRDRVKVDDERELVEIVAERITDDVELDWSGGMPVFESAPAVDWAAVERLRAQSERLNQEIVLEAIRRVMEAVRAAEAEAAQADEALAEELLLAHDREALASLSEMVREQAERYRAAKAVQQAQPPAPEPEPPPEPPRDGLMELASVVRALVGVMAAPKEVIRDANGRVVGVQSGASPDAPADLDGALEAIRADLGRISVREVVRDPQTTRVVGVRTIQ
jgi:hypothetical protein